MRSHKGMKSRGRAAIWGSAGLAFLSLVCLLLLFCTQTGWAVSSKIVRHSSSVDLLKGEAKDVVVGSQGTLQLGRAWESLVDDFEDVWSINSIVVSGGTIFIGTSPNGGIYKYSLGESTKIYPLESAVVEEEPVPIISEGGDEEEPAEEEEYLANEHIFAMATDMAGRLLASISGDKCRLIRFEGNTVETVFEPNDAMYIFAIASDDKGNVYLGTGPEGKVYRYDPFSAALSGLVYDSLDKNILSLAIDEDGSVYAGSDSRGLIYKIDPAAKTATVLYDSDQPEITALLFNGQGDLYAAGTSAKIVAAQTKFASQQSMSGRPEGVSGNKPSASNTEGGMQLKIAHTEKRGGDKPTPRKPPAPKPPKPGQASFIYKITKDGYVTNVFSEAVVLFALAQQDDNLLIGTGNTAQLFTVDPTSEREAIIFEDEQASQITAMVVSGQDLYLGTANPAKLIKLSKDLINEGTYSSDLVDAGQPAKWGKLQIDADIPQGCKVLLSSRSGNVSDVNDPTFSEWTKPLGITGPVQLRSPLGRFCQYKLVLQSDGEGKGPIVREVAVASTVPNLAPKVASVSASQVKAAGKKSVLKIGYKAKDGNDDVLIYKIDFRKVGRAGWIELKDEVETDSFEWDGKTVEDGRYEIRITASDERSNTSATKLTGTRVSDPVVVDNTGPSVTAHSIEAAEGGVTLRLQISDEFSAIANLSYTVDSNAEWIGAIPDDLVYDTTEESFTIAIGDLEAGEHIVAVRIKDDVGNTTYRTFEVVSASN